MFQSTLGSVVFIEGIGAHSGRYCRLSIHPASENQGIIFTRNNLKVAANYENVSETTMYTKLSSHEMSTMTTEHLLAALYGLGVSNAVIECDEEEIPILDGSSIQFVQKILSAGIKKQFTRRKALKILKKVKIEDGQKWSSIAPSDNFAINIECDYTKNGLATSPLSFDFSKGNFEHDIAPSRTFGFFSDIEFLRNNKLAAGASLDNAVVFDSKGFPMNSTGLRFNDEPIRHKILDVIGDLSLSQCEIFARFDGFCTCHKMNNLLLRAVFEDKSNFEIIE